MVSNTKRRRSQAFPSAEVSEDATNNGSELGHEDRNVFEENVQRPGEPEVDEKELTRLQGIWDSFIEEFHETTEQLPLYLHRLFMLLREQDVQIADNCTEIMNILQKYISMRKFLATPAKTPPTRDVIEDNGDVEWTLPSSSERRTPRINPSLTRRSSSRTVRTASQQSARMHAASPPTASLTSRSTTRGFINQIAILTDDILHSSHEKFNLAVAAYDSVDRHIRLLDQAIKEQEASISLSLRPGTHAILLPDVPVPKATRQPRVEPSPAPNVDTGTDGNTEGEPLSGLLHEEVSRHGGRSNLKKARKRFKASAADSAEPENLSSPPPSRSVKPRAPPLSTIQSGERIDPNEPKYCYCRDVSHGEMVACDNEDCPNEWFHLECVGLSIPPSDSKPWFCRDCQHLRSSVNAKRKGRRSL